MIHHDPDSQGSCSLPALPPTLFYGGFLLHTTAFASCGACVQSLEPRVTRGVCSLQLDPWSSLAANRKFVGNSQPSSSALSLPDANPVRAAISRSHRDPPAFAFGASSARSGQGLVSYPRRGGSRQPAPSSARPSQLSTVRPDPSRKYDHDHLTVNNLSRHESTHERSSPSRGPASRDSRMPCRSELGCSSPWGPLGVILRCQGLFWP